MPPWARSTAIRVAAAAMLGLGGCSLLLDFDDPSAADASVEMSPADAGVDDAPPADAGGI